MKYMVSFDSVSSVKSFVNIVSGYDYDFELVSGNYVLNAKSIMGIFALDLSVPIELNISCPSSDSKLEEELKPFITNTIL